MWKSEDIDHCKRSEEDSMRRKFKNLSPLPCISRLQWDESYVILKVRDGTTRWRSKNLYKKNLLCFRV